LKAAAINQPCTGVILKAAAINQPCYSNTQILCLAITFFLTSIFSWETHHPKRMAIEAYILIHAILSSSKSSHRTANFHPCGNYLM